MEDDTDLCWALLAQDPFGYGLPPEHAEAFPEWDVPLDRVQTAIFNYYFVDS
jgi:hypothetical protein